MVQSICESHERQKRFGAIVPLSSRHGYSIKHRQFDILQRRRPGKQIEVLKHESNLLVSNARSFIACHLHHLGSIESLLCGAAPVPESLIVLYAARGIAFCQVYGLTETAPFSSFLTPEWTGSKLGSAGQPPLYSATRIVDDNNRPLSAGERGEICLRGPNIMKGYWNRPEATAAAIDPEGWFHSGDVGYLDEDGFLYICDRLKDMVISGGENVYPAEVEGALYKHESIAEVAVIGLPDEKWGEAVTAVVALHDGHQLTLEELREFAQPLLARYKLPLRLHIVSALPRNPAGKVLKFVLKDDLQT